MARDSMDFVASLRHAIKGPHAAIHRLNLSRIALCLPPQTYSPSLYTLGISRYAELYYGIEEAWLSITGDPGDWICESDNIIQNLQSIQDGKRIQALLRLLYIPGLLRTKALEADLCRLQSLSGVQTAPVEEPNLGSEMRKDVYQRSLMSPHILVAHIWIMYSAILYGGSEICAQLRKAGPAFWGLSAAELSSRQAPCPLSFWHFDDPATTKVQLRARVAEIECFLTPQEQQDVLSEAKEIFRQLETLTLHLDKNANHVPE
ncbi:hypothetical protein N7462_010526 [Penicillium macrosclerotiorum]|uniref:uncharacterized protein n=1 Tax=Penicillium macrosclerotiorum TaxID=303699 RepID=UPI0025488FE7|nr:uncharacterized protein N7462_010526 [Penicillium macrosclerotiorum]KAJ5669456.1 hypothetical protein N7462_010526 [Penicillium macrosclerotiorum]